MADSSARLVHIKGAIRAIHDGMDSLTVDVVETNPFLAGGFRYQLLIISEAARSIPVGWKQEFGPDINWRRLEDLGNRLRHAYHNINATILWSIYEHDLDPLEAAIDRMIAAHGPTAPRSRST